MRRLHRFEFEDLDRVPRPIRDGRTDLVDRWFDRLGFYDRVAPNLLTLLETTRASCVVHLCAGGGGGTLQMPRQVRAAGSPAEVVLSDRNPNQASDRAGRRARRSSHPYRADLVDAMTGGGKRNGMAHQARIPRRKLSGEVRSGCKTGRDVSTTLAAL